MEGYVRLLAPELSKLMPRMRDDLQSTARIVLRYANELGRVAHSSGSVARQCRPAAISRATFKGLHSVPAESIGTDQYVARAPVHSTASALGTPR